MPGMRSEIAGVGGVVAGDLEVHLRGCLQLSPYFPGMKRKGWPRSGPNRRHRRGRRDRRDRKGKDLPRIYADRRGSRKIAGIGPSGDRFIGSSACRTMRDRRERESRMTGHRTGCTKIRIPLAVSTGVRRDHKKRRTISFASRTPRDLPRAAMISDFLLS